MPRGCEALSFEFKINSFESLNQDSNQIFKITIKQNL